MINCPNCGAPIKGNVCEYCGTVFKDRYYLEITQQQTEFALQQTLDHLLAHGIMSVQEYLNRRR